MSPYDQMLSRPPWQHATHKKALTTLIISIIHPIARLRPQ
jgi:hypothetical protein